MKRRYLLIAGLFFTFASCSTAYRVGQTPDDVYYSPAPPQEEYVTTTNQQERDAYGYDNGSSSEDYAIRRGINDLIYRNNSSLDFGYGYGDPYNGYGSSLYSPYSYSNPYLYSGITFYPNNYNYYDPYYSSYNYYYAPLYFNLKPGNSVSNYNVPRRYNLGVYNRTGTISNYTTPVITNTGSAPVRTFATPAPANTSGFGGFVRRIFTPNNASDRATDINNGRNANNNNNYNNTPTRSFQSSTPSSGSSSSGGGGGSAPVRTFRR
jgi:hypothetical protein